MAKQELIVSFYESVNGDVKGKLIRIAQEVKNELQKSLEHYLDAAASMRLAQELLTPTNGFSVDSMKPLTRLTPTRKPVKEPGPLVMANPSTSFRPIPLSDKTLSTIINRWPEYDESLSAEI